MPWDIEFKGSKPNVPSLGTNGRSLLANDGSLLMNDRRLLKTKKML